MQKPLSALNELDKSKVLSTDEPITPTNDKVRPVKPFQPAPSTRVESVSNEVRHRSYAPLEASQERDIIYHYPPAATQSAYNQPHYVTLNK